MQGSMRAKADLTWMNKHPSALRNFDSVLAAAKGKQVVMFLNYDGTLSPIVQDPDKAFMAEDVDPPPPPPSSSS
ncbi:hypothetical protein BRADI_1g22545v3 [Brachypodium distachyon]|uniref:Uncharacterized protein n=1 Tax=Brachypodium distachyon TaxID=15368 RepID=A0A0Q3RQU0_BRADI|nr:hypothetical protein BRADI_1g22545v3 [Brachypodium distachyon]